MMAFIQNLLLAVVNTPWLWATVKGLLMISVVMSLAGYCVLAERKICARIQNRLGPNRAAFPLVASIPVLGPWLTRLGLWQPLADGLKFLFKEDPIPGHVHRFYYCLGPVLAVVPALTLMVAVPFGQYIDAQGRAVALVLADIEIGPLFILAVSSLGVYGVVVGAWASNSKYPFLGGIRASAQMIAYELTMGLSLIPVFLWANPPGHMSSLRLSQLVFAQSHVWLVFLQPLSAFLFLIALFAETNRLPFDMAESETDLVGGFHTEYGSFKFGLYFVAEYAHMVLGSALFAVLFLGGWHFLPGMPAPWASWGAMGALCSVLCLLVKVAALLFLFIWVRWTLPRFRYDQVMQLGWNMLLPLAIVNVVVNVLVFSYIDQVDGFSSLLSLWRSS
jgi:NADH-quinone oxidoreductase subunit H